MNTRSRPWTIWKVTSRPWSRKKNKTLFLRADKEVPYGVVVDVMGRIKAVGIEKLGVVADSSESLSPAAARQPPKAEVVSDELGLVSSFPLPASGGLPADHVLAQLASGEPGDAAGDDQPGGRRPGGNRTPSSILGKMGKPTDGPKDVSPPAKKADAAAPERPEVKADPTADKARPVEAKPEPVERKPELKHEVKPKPELQRRHSRGRQKKDKKKKEDKKKGRRQEARKAQEGRQEEGR